MSKVGLLCLKWNNHSSAFEKLLYNLHLKEVYSDATIICQGKFYPVHQFVLSTCSEYFDDVFNHSTMIKCKHPFVIVKDLTNSQIEALLNYMYKGEVNVPQETLHDLINAAEAFKIKGLAVADDEPPIKRCAKNPKRSKTSHCFLNKKRRVEEKLYKNSRNDTQNVAHQETDSEYIGIKQLKDSDNSILTSESSSAEDEIETCDSSGNDKRGRITNDLLQPNTEIKAENLEELPEEDQLSYSNHIEEFGVSLGDDTPIKKESIDTISEEVLSHTITKDNETNLQACQVTSQCTELAKGKKKISSLTQIEKAESILENSDDLIGYYVGSNDDTYQCLMCPYNGKTKYNMRRHALYKHSKAKPFKCKFCSYRYVTNSELRTHHLCRHSTEKPYKCPICNYECALKSMFQSHFKVHTGERSFQCPLCSFSAIQSTHYQNHLKLHEESKSLSENL